MRPNHLINGPGRKKKENTLPVPTTMSELDRQIEYLTALKKDMKNENENQNEKKSKNNRDIKSVQKKSRDTGQKVYPQKMTNKKQEKCEIDKNSTCFLLKMKSPGKFLVQNDMTMYNEEEQTYQIFFELKNIEDRYIKNYDSDNNILILELPMKKKGSYISVIIRIDLNKRKDGIIECPFWIKIN